MSRPSTCITPLVIGCCGAGGRMTRERRLCTVAALLCFATVAAYGQAQPEPPGKSDRATTIVGCLVQSPSATAEEFFVRTPAIAVPPGSTVAVGGTGSASGGRATTSAGTPDATTAYRITGLTAAQLKPHLGHRVELQGQLSGNTPPATTATTRQDLKTGRATTTVNQDLTIAGVLHATAVKMLSASCQ
jgi:hypothetical protein